MGTPRLMSPASTRISPGPSGMAGADGRAASTLSTPAYVSAPVICRAIGSGMPTDIRLRITGSLSGGRTTTAGGAATVTGAAVATGTGAGAGTAAGAGGGGTTRATAA